MSRDAADVLHGVFGVAATFKPVVSGGSNVSITVELNRDAQRLTESQGVEMIETTPTITVRRSELASWARGDHVEIDSVTYRLEEKVVDDGIEVTISARKT